MGISIRDPKVGELARQLARLRGTNMTEAIGHALREQLRREREKVPLVDRIRAIAEETVAMGKPGGHAMTKDEIDDLWGQ